jgi:cell division protein FtsB
VLAQQKKAVPALPVVAKKLGATQVQQTGEIDELKKQNAMLAKRIADLEKK